MIFEAKNFVGDNDSIIEIVATDSAFGLIKKSTLDTLKVCLPLKLSLDNNGIIEYEEDINKLKSIIDDNKTLRVWLSKKDVDEYRLLLFICNMFKDKNISIIDINIIDENAFCVGCLDTKQIECVDNITHILSDVEKENYSNEWIRLINENMN